MPEGRRYTEDEVRAILERALTRSRSPSSGMSHDELVAAAAEIGISATDIARAADEVEGGRDEREARAHILDVRRRGFSAHLWAFLGVNVFLLAINLLTTPAILWFVFPLLGWGLGLFFHARVGLSKQVSDGAVRREVERRVKARKKQKKREDDERRKEDKERKKLPENATAFERGAAELGSAVEEGGGVLMSKLAEEIRGGTGKPKRSKDGVRVAGLDRDDEQRRERDSDADLQAEAEAEAEEAARGSGRRRR